MPASCTPQAHVIATARRADRLEELARHCESRIQTIAGDIADPVHPQAVIEMLCSHAPAAQLSSLLLSAYGLTGAQSRVVELVIRGHSTRQIVGELHISANTVQEHLTAAFDKFGVRSRRELVAAMLTGRSDGPASH